VVVPTRLTHPVNLVPDVLGDRFEVLLGHHRAHQPDTG
jgi:hypothetical protein